MEITKLEYDRGRGNFRWSGEMRSFTYYKISYYQICAYDLNLYQFLKKFA